MIITRILRATPALDAKGEARETAANAASPPQEYFEWGM